jgi:hypothetical protein
LQGAREIFGFEGRACRGEPCLGIAIAGACVNAAEQGEREK